MSGRKKTSLEYDSTVLFVLLMMANACNYLFQIATGRMLTVEEYSIVNTVFSIYSVFSMACGAVTLVVAKYIAIHMAMENRWVLRCFMETMIRIVVALALLCGLAVIFASPFMARLWKLPTDLAALSVLLTIFATLGSITKGVHQGLQDFWGYGLQNLLGMMTKLLLSIFLLFLGWKVYGVMLALFLAAIFPIAYSLRMQRGFFLCLKEKSAQALPVDNRAVYRLLGYTLITQGVIALFTNGDILLVRAFFDDTTTGLYSSAMVMGKIAIYVSQAVVSVALPKAADLYARGESTKSLFVRSNLYGGGMAVISALGLLAFGRLVIPFLFGEKYSPATELLPAACLFVIPVTFLTIISNYVIAVGQMAFFTATLFGALAACLVYAVLNHGTVFVLFAGLSVILGVAAAIDIICLFAQERNREIRNEKN